MRQNTAVLGITCFIEASSVALRESRRKKMGGKKEDPKESAPEEFNKKKKESRRIRHKEEAGMQLCCAQIAWFNEASAINTARRRKMGFIYR